VVAVVVVQQAVSVSNHNAKLRAFFALQFQICCTWSIEFRRIVGKRLNNYVDVN